MSRFIDPSAILTVSLGPCQCPAQGKHEQDEIILRRHLSGIDQLAVASGADLGEQYLRLIHRGGVSWNLLDEKGKPVPLDLEHIRLLDDDTISAVVDALNDANEDEDPLPNSSGAPSLDSSPGSASPNRAARRKSKQR